MRFGASLVILTTMLAVALSGNIAAQITPGLVVLNLGQPSNPGGCSRLGSGGPCDIYFGQNQNTASPSASPLPTSNFDLWVYAGTSGYSTDYMVRAHGFSVTMNNFIVSNFTGQNPNNARVTISVDKSFFAQSIIVGPYGYLWADASVTQQSSVSITTNFFYMLANSVVDAGNGFDVVVNTQTTFTAIGSAAPYYNVAKSVFYGNTSLYGAVVSASVGLEFSSTTVIDGCTKVTAPIIWVKHPYNIPFTSDTVHCTSTCNLFNTNGGNFYVSSPVVISNCNTTTGTWTIIPPVNYQASFGNTSSTGSSNTTGGTKHKRDGSTQQSTYNSGTTTTNSIVQTANYVSGPLFRRRDAPSRKRIVAQNNLYQVINGHIVTLTQMTQQNNQAQYLVSCDSRMRWLGGNASVIAKECGAGCPQNSTCPNGGNIVSIPRSKKREVEQE